MTTGKTIALARQNFVGKVMFLIFNMLSRLIIALLPRSKYLLISWLQSPSAVILEPKIHSTIFIWRKKWWPTPVLLPGKSHGWRSLVGYSPWSRKELDTPERLQFTHFILYHWRRKWQHTPVFLPGESQGQRSLVGHGPWRRRESDTTEVTEHALSL